MSKYAEKPPAKFQWRGEPAEWEQQPDVVCVEVDAGTDFWRKTHDGGIRDNGHFYFRVIEGDFIAEVELRGEYQGQYDHAGLMARFDQATWLKCGIEYVDGVHLASAVVTRDWSDWSVMPIASQNATWWRLARHGHTFQVACSVDGKNFQTVRQAFLTENSRVEVGVMACAPKGDGFSVTFSNLTVEGTS
jgi:regulation of enolase protein 1 (concanavalin A-like superfamily)